MFGSFKRMVFCKISRLELLHAFGANETLIAFYVPGCDRFFYLCARCLVRLRFVLSRRLATQSCPSNESSVSVCSEFA
jgi:hypothetical protein